MHILFICTGNTCRSPMAAALMTQLLADRGRSDVEVTSAGLAAADEPASRHAVEALAEWDIDLSGHRSQPATPQLWEQADLIAVMGPAHADALIGLGADPRRIVVLGVADPYGGSLDVYRRTRDQLAAVLQQQILPRIVGDAAPDAP